MIAAMTEAQARTKECRINGVVEKNRAIAFPRCIASNCMGWEWRELGWPEYRSPFNGTVIAQATDGKGYCSHKRAQ